MNIDRLSSSVDDDQPDEKPTKPERNRAEEPGSVSRADARRTRAEAGSAVVEAGAETANDGTGTSQDDDPRSSTADSPQMQARERKPVEAGTPVSGLERMPSHGGFANLAEEFEARAKSRERARAAAKAVVAEAALETDTQQAHGVTTERPPPASAASHSDTAKETDSDHSPYAQRLDVPIVEGEPSPREVLERFDPARANLPEISTQEAADYIDQNADQRPWLATAKDCDPAVQRVIAAMDQGQGHALERHEGYADDGKLIRRVTALEDPAQLDPEKRTAGIDGCKPGNRDHRCDVTATAIQDPDAFATAFARGTEHPKVRDVLESPYNPRQRPPRISIPIEELLGVEAERHCSGYRLAPVGGDSRAAMDCRDAWVEAQAKDREPDVPQPRAFPVDSFDRADVQYVFRPTRARDGYEVATMYIEFVKT